MEQAVQDDEGLIYVFRGRKIFRRFADSVAEGNGQEMHSMSDQSARIRHMAGSAAHRPITRSSLKPRLLFASPQGGQIADEVDEEADTDIEDEANHRGALSATGDEMFAPLEPESAPGSQAVADIADHSPTVPKASAAHQKAKKSSPFDSWPRQKPGAAKNTSQGTKRSAGEPVQPVSGKRTRSGAHTA